jgi:hypothetical protein
VTGGPLLYQQQTPRRLIVLNLGSSLLEAFTEGATLAVVFLAVVFLAVEVLSAPAAGFTSSCGSRPRQY